MMSIARLLGLDDVQNYLPNYSAFLAFELYNNSNNYFVKVVFF